MKITSSFILFLFFILIGQHAFAHEIRPAYLEIKQTASESYDILWKVPALGETKRLGIYVELPERCIITKELRATMFNSSLTERWSVKCSGRLSGETIRIEGLSATMTDVLVRFENLDGSIQTARMTPSSPSFIVAKKIDAMDVVYSYTILGIEHILSGIDHLLFVLALLIITKGGWKLVKTVTAFTISHTISLTLATLGYVHIPQKPVEAVIALSIVFIATEILHQRQGKPGITSRSPWIVAFLFGLIHGLGFAGALSETGLPNDYIPTALLFFSIGVEAGHLLFISLVLLLMSILYRATSKLSPYYQQRLAFIQLLPTYFIGSVAMFWMIHRILIF
jgi:hydrogenase/urease accessory protein HupE